MNKFTVGRRLLIVGKVVEQTAGKKPLLLMEFKNGVGAKKIKFWIDSSNVSGQSKHKRKEIATR